MKVRILTTVGWGFQPFLRFWNAAGRARLIHEEIIVFQPFLRFWGLCGWLLWVFKFFFGFLSSRRSAWNHALHSFHAALGRDEAPFFGAPKKRKREKRRKRTPFFAVGGLASGLSAGRACPVDPSVSVGQDLLKGGVSLALCRRFTASC
jgi:hypothetical protein